MSSDETKAAMSLRQALRNVGQPDDGSLLELAQRTERWTREVTSLFGSPRPILPSVRAQEAADAEVDDEPAMEPEELAALRQEIGCTRHELAEKLGVTAFTMWQWEQGRQISGYFSAKLRKLLAKHRAGKA